MKSKINKAPYLTIAGNPINKEEKYYTVNRNDGEILEEVAGEENNVRYECYFLKYDDARSYSRQIKLLEALTKSIKEIEETCLGK